jgi:hypothetical protein
MKQVRKPAREVGQYRLPDGKPNTPWRRITLRIQTDSSISAGELVKLGLGPGWRGGWGVRHSSMSLCLLRRRTENSAPLLESCVTQLASVCGGGWPGQQYQCKVSVLEEGERREGGLIVFACQQICTERERQPKGGADGRQGGRVAGRAGCAASD